MNILILIWVIKYPHDKFRNVFFNISLIQHVLFIHKLLLNNLRKAMLSQLHFFNTAHRSFYIKNKII